MIGPEHILIIAALALICAVGLAAMRRRQEATRSTPPRRSLPVASRAGLAALRPPPAAGKERLN